MQTDVVMNMFSNKNDKECHMIKLMEIILPLNVVNARKSRWSNAMNIDSEMRMSLKV